MPAAASRCRRSRSRTGPSGSNAHVAGDDTLELSAAAHEERAVIGELDRIDLELARAVLDGGPPSERRGRASPLVHRGRTRRRIGVDDALDLDREPCEERET